MSATTWHPDWTTAVDSWQRQPQLRAIAGLLPEITDPRQLCETVFATLESLLSGDEDQNLLRTLSEVVGEIISRIQFDADEDQLQRETRRAASACLRVLQTAHQKRSVGSAQGPLGAYKEFEYWLPPHLAHLLKRLDTVVPALPPAMGGFTSFEALCDAAVSRRMDHVLVFFQRHNPNFSRSLPPLFLLSPEFGHKIKTAATRLIFPIMRENRQVRVLSSSVNLAKVDSGTIWEHLDENLKSKLFDAWNAAWDALKLAPDVFDADARPKMTNPGTSELIEIIKPSSSSAYDLPRLSNAEIDVFKSLFDVENDWWERLNEAWRAICDLYEQEMDPRVFQQQAREGALRDGLLRLFEEFPEQWSDFLVLLSHRVFPRIGTSYIESLVTSLGQNEAARERRAPYLMPYLKKARASANVAVEERRLLDEWIEQSRQLRAYLKGYTEEI
jgi:hypothetical protein